MQYRVAYIGCGAVVERSHLPSIAQVDELTPRVLIDSNQEQIRQLSQRYDVAITDNDYTNHLDDFDIAVVATPSATHFDICRDLLNADKHVLVEKPVSSTYAQAAELVNLANEKSRILAVCLVRRYLSSFQMFKSLMDSDLIGRVQSFKLEEGGIFGWPVQSPSFFDKEQSGGGVLMDTGPHILDALLWWLGDYTTVDYRDDSMGGIEADCELTLTLKCGAHGIVRLSRIRTLENSIVVTGERGSVSMNLGNGEISLRFANNNALLTGAANNPEEPLTTTVDLFAFQYRQLLLSLDNGLANPTDQLVTADKCLRSINLIEECYKNAKPITPIQY